MDDDRRLPHTALVVAAPPGFAATGMIAACAGCRLRFAPRHRCPRCGARGLVDLGSGEQLASVEPHRGEALAAIIWLLGLPLLVVSAGLAVVWFVLVWALAPILRRMPPRALRPRAFTTLPRGDECSAVGTVRVTRPALSPLSTSCAAWRVRGRVPRTVIDDAGVGAFDVVRDGRVVARVRAADALLDLGAGPRPTSRQLDGRLATFLAERDGLPPDGRAHLSETLLRDGDAVEVIGVADEAVLASGYRESRTVPLFRDWPTIRKLEPVR